MRHILLKGAAVLVGFYNCEFTPLTGERKKNGIIYAVMWD